MEHLQTDVWGTAEKFQKEGSGIYDLILLASLNARDIAKRRNFIDQKEGRINKYSMKPINQALKDIEDEINSPN